MRVDQSGVLIVDEAEHQIGGSGLRSGRHAGFWVDCRTGMSSGSGVGDATHLRAACDDVDCPLRCRFCRLLVASCLALGECVFAFVCEQVLEVTPLEEVGDLEAELYAVWGRVTVISVKLAILGDIPLGVWIVRLPWPPNGVAHVLHDSYTLNGFDIEGVLGDPSSVPVV